MWQYGACNNFLNALCIWAIITLFYSVNTKNIFNPFTSKCIRFSMTIKLGKRSYQVVLTNCFSSFQCNSKCLITCMKCKTLDLKVWWATLKSSMWRNCVSRNDSATKYTKTTTYFGSETQKRIFLNGCIFTTYIILKLRQGLWLW